MSAFPGGELPRTLDEIAPPPEERELFARIEGLIGEEIALLEIPARERTAAHDARLEQLTRDLDRLWDRLRERAVALERRLGKEPP
jgi:transposase